MNTPVTIHWFRRDLRLSDNAALYAALKSGAPVVPIFIFDTEILNRLTNKKDARVDFIHRALTQLRKELNLLGSDLHVFHGSPLEVWKEILQKWKVQGVYTNRDYEPYAQQRDKIIFDFLQSQNIPFKGAKDSVIFEKDEVLKDDGKPYTVFTPYSRKWKSRLNAFYLKSYPTEKYFESFLQHSANDFPSLSEIGFEKSDIDFPPLLFDRELIAHYGERRDIPSIKGTSRLSVHLRFGTVSIRQAAQHAQALSGVWLNELIWRDFYQMILFHFPETPNKAFKPSYDRIPWLNDHSAFEKWCQGKTGYPIVDAGMRELNTTGFMHNRVRMITASFLVKHLLIDWRWGERYFAEKLIDFDLASNVGGWQWAASSGCDAAPYFRVFNPTEQTKKFDPNFAYIKKWVPEFGTSSYPAPMVDHKYARERVLNTFKTALKEA